MTIYQKELARIVAERFGAVGPGELVARLCEMGVVDHTLCKVLAVREHVGQLVKAGTGKVDAMWMAAERFCATYEYVRKCVYYYTDVNIRQ